MKIAICQINPVVGDIEHNLALMLEECHHAKNRGALLAIFPELSLTGYPPKDLLLRQDFLDACEKGLADFAQKTPLFALVGAPTKNAPFRPFNSVALCGDNVVTVVAHKQLLPNYNVFDEERYFSPDPENGCRVLNFKGFKLLISICEDAWNSLDIEKQPKYAFDPIATGINKHGLVDIIINLSASPYSTPKVAKREKVFTHLAKVHQKPVLHCGQVGANDQLLFDGQSLIINSQGQICGRGKMCEEDVLIFDSDIPLKPIAQKKSDKWQDLLKVLTMGIKDYVAKCRAPGLILGLSGGIDSAVCLALACRALGKDRVRAVYLPSQYSSPHSEGDARSLAQNLGIDLEIIPIEEAVAVFRRHLAGERKHASQKNWDIFDQNLQSRTRGVFIMGMANACGYLMVATSNKSELAMGYTTIYGDMCGAFAPIGDLYKTSVYHLAQALNKDSEILPLSILEKEPTAELKPNQKDSDSLPKYNILDEILYRFIDDEKSALDIQKETGIELSLINSVISSVNQSEFKRRQAPFSFMVSDKVFGYARRLPIAKNFSYL